MKKILYMAFFFWGTNISYAHDTLNLSVNYPSVSSYRDDITRCFKDAFSHENQENFIRFTKPYSCQPLLIKDLDTLYLDLTPKIGEVLNFNFIIKDEKGLLKYGTLTVNIIASENKKILNPA